MKDCYYCEKGEKLNQLMTHIADMGNASIYLFRDQTHKGKCIVVFNTDHRTEWYQLNQEEQSELIYAVAKTAEALHNVFNPDKINYATYGDKVSHLHVHVVPKYENGPRNRTSLYFRRCGKNSVRRRIYQKSRADKRTFDIKVPLKVCRTSLVRQIF